jgi:hypothetical protein
VKKSHAIYAIILLSGIPIAMLASCATTVIPPQQPPQPVTVYLIDLGRTPTLAMPRDDNTFVRYVYGDWNWYALRKEGAVEGLVALLWPTQGALGRCVIQQPADARDMLLKFNIGAEHVYALEVERQRVDEFHRRMDEAFTANADSRMNNEVYALEFVHHPRAYTVFHNSNHETALWLRDLGCQTRGPAMTSQWIVKGD